MPERTVRRDLLGDERDSKLRVELAPARLSKLVEVAFEYADLFSPEMDRHPEIESLVAAGTAAPPVVTIDGGLAFSGGKLNVSAIERAVGVALRAASEASSPQASEALFP